MFNHIITRDETWVSYKNVDSKKQSITIETTLAADFFDNGIRKLV